MNIREILTAVPYSYDDFVRFSMECIDEDIHVKEAILNQLRMNPESDANDITRVIVNHLGIGEPLELVEDEEESLVVTA